MRNTGSLPRTTGVITAVIALVHGSWGQSGFVTLEGRQFMLDGEPFYPVVMNYSVELVSNVPGSVEPSDLYFSPATHYDANVFSHYECNNEPSCTDQLQIHFEKLVSMGFNAIRLLCPPLMSEEGPGGEQKYRLELRYNNGEWPPPYAGFLDVPDFSGPLAERYFEILRTVISIADNAGLKTILLCAEDYNVDDGDPNNGESWYQLTLAENEEAVELYRKYLGRLANELRDEPGLIAYDLWNEPNWTAGHLTGLTKAQVCEYTERWYDTIREADPLHLVTLGGSSYHEISSWDPAVMKLDFYSPHHYPAPAVVFNYDNDLANESLKAQFYWLGADCPMPWLIGETGFIAENDNVDPLDATLNCNGNHLDPDPVYDAMPWTGGTEEEQAAFADLSLHAVRDYRGSGYSWWDFQNARFSDLNIQDQFPNEPEKWLQGNFFGLLKFGNHAPIVAPQVPCALPEWSEPKRWRDKIAVSTFAGYDPGEAPTELPSPPTNYGSWHNTGGEVYRQYTIMDEETGEPIPHALATVEWFYRTADETDNENVGASLWERNTTNLTGDAIIHSRNATNDVYVATPEAKRLFIDAFGSEHRIYDDENGVPWPSDDEWIALQRNRLIMDDAVTDHTVPMTGIEVHSAWSTLTLTDVLVQGDVNSGGIADFKARDQVHAQQEFHAQQGAGVHLFTEATFLECVDVIDGMAPFGQQGTRTKVRGVDAIQKKLLLNFEQRDPQIRVFPNPCTTALQVVLRYGAGQCIVTNSAGAIVFKSTASSSIHVLDVSTWAAGDYTVHVTTVDGESITTITKI